MAKRFFDIVVVTIGMIVLSPLFLIIIVMVLFSGQGGVFFKQQRVGKGGKTFWLYKFRTMKPNAEKKGQLTVGGRDPRITKVGYFLRKFKLDELPQLWNVLNGSMSMVGPRPEVPKYVEMYNKEQRKVLDVRPGITDLASIEYINENEILGNSDNPEHMYIQKVMPDKLKLNMKYIETRSFVGDLKIILRTIGKIFT